MADTEIAITRLERKHPQVYVFSSNTTVKQGNKETPALHYATDDAQLAFAVIGIHTAHNMAAFTLNQAKALMDDLPHIIAELEGRNG